MATTPDAAPDTSAVIKELSTYLISDYCIVSAEALMIWHYLTTFDKEVKRFWKRKLSGASALFFANRYLALAVVVLNVLIASRVCFTLTDVIVLMATWLSTYKWRNTDGFFGDSETTLASVLFRDGSIYFIALTTVNLLYMLLSITSITTGSDPDAKLFNNVVLSPYIPPITAIIVDYFLVHLHEAAASGAASELSRWSQGTLRFARHGSTSSTDELEHEAADA
ncbi:hypothetical protein BV20DRAFT_1056101 [Pilatotrama ljubarskyi]|nr:hypothetical protein BV20DRAFT_1056101 [Pilatotrama ljubarskyi]